MKRAEQVLPILVGAFAVVVAIAVARAPRPPRQSRRATLTADPGVVPDAPKVTTRSAPVADVAVQSANVAPQRDTADIRLRLSSASGTYMPDMLGQLNRSLQRWTSKPEGLRIWVQTLTPVRDYDDQYAQMARNAFEDWKDGLPMPLNFVMDSASADVRVVWIDRFPPSDGLRIGVTSRWVDQYGWLTSASIAIAIHDSTGARMPPANLAGVARHEAGHALGMGHSRDPRTIMFPVQMMTEVQPADRATLYLLYSLPPGPVP